MRRRTGKVARWELVVLAGVALLLFAVMVRSRHTARAPDYELCRQAAQLSQTAFNAIKSERKRLGLIVDPINDPNQTGLIGSQYSLITSGRGDLNGVMTATNPNFVAVVLSLFRRARLKKGDIVALGFDGSLPALNIEVLAACSILGLRPTIISSLSSAMWGANDPLFTWLDMETVLNRTGILPFRSAAASLGGEDDNGRGLSPAGRAWLDSAVVRNRVPLLTAQSPAEAAEQRLMLYRRSAGTGKIRAFVNVGNSTVNLGADPGKVPTGIVDRRAAQLPEPSLVRLFAEQGTTIINLHDVTRLAFRYRFPVAPVPLPPLAKGRLFLEPRYRTELAAIFAAILVVLLFFVIRYDLDYYVRRRVNDDKRGDK